MKSDKKIDDALAMTYIPNRLPGDSLSNNPVINRYWQSLHRENVDNVCFSRTIELLREAVGNEISYRSRIMAWDNQRIFGPVPQSGNSSEKVELEAD